MKIGILSRATGASDKTKVGAARDAVGLALDEIQSAYLDAYATDSGTADVKAKINEKELVKSLNNQGFDLFKKGTATPLNESEAASDAKLGNPKASYVVCASGTKEGLEVAFDGTADGYVVKVTFGTTEGTNTVEKLVKASGT